MGPGDPDTYGQANKGPWSTSPPYPFRDPSFNSLGHLRYPPSDYGRTVLRLTETYDLPPDRRAFDSPPLFYLFLPQGSQIGIGTDWNYGLGLRSGSYSTPLIRFAALFLVNEVYCFPSVATALNRHRTVREDGRPP